MVPNLKLDALSRWTGPTKIDGEDNEDQVMPPWPNASKPAEWLRPAESFDWPNQLKPRSRPGLGHRSVGKPQLT